MDIDKVKALVPINGLVIPLSKNTNDVRGLKIFNGRLKQKGKSIPIHIPKVAIYNRFESGIHTFVVPVDVYRLTYSVYAAGGGGGSGANSQGGLDSKYRGGNGGDGALLTGEIDVVPGETLVLEAGKGGVGGTLYPRLIQGGQGNNSGIYRNGNADIIAIGGQGGALGKLSGGSASHSPNSKPVGGAKGGQGGRYNQQPGEKGQDGYIILNYMGYL